MLSGFSAGRHMLTEMLVDNYIPNDTHMTEDESRVQVRLWSFDEARIIHLLSMSRKSSAALQA